MDLFQKERKKMAIKFWGPDEKYGLFSNFANTPLVIDGDHYPTAEHYFQAMKTVNSADWKRIVEAYSPKDAKHLGRKVQMREDWETVKCTVMMTVLQEKAQQCPAFRELLLSTGDEELIEDSPFDYYWGCGRDGSGRNMLGELLMDVRTELREE